MSFRAKIATVCCLICGPFLLVRYYTQPLPERDELEVVTGIVDRVVMEERRSGRIGTVKYPVIYLRDDPRGYDYLDWFPRADSITDTVRPNASVAISVNGASDDRIWELTVNGRKAFAFEEIHRKIKGNRAVDPWLGGGMTFFGIIGLLGIIGGPDRGDPNP